ncbi:hypothetical protein ACT17S_17720 [Glutamicibacter mysorens]
METQEFNYDEIRVEFKERPAQQDRHHLIVVFSGFRPEHSPYDFDGAASTTLRSHMLWIRDDFDGNMTYYIRDKKGYEISEAVNALIELKRMSLGLEKDQCTFVGFSKGGTAALYHGLKFEYPNVLVSAPRIRVGSANQDQRPDIIEGMTSSGSSDEIAELDNLIPDLLRERSDSDTNFYWFSSEADHFHETETLPILELLREYRNFNYFQTDSDLVRRHRDVTLYNMPLIMSILAALGEGAVPSFGEKPNGGQAMGKRTDTDVLQQVRHRGELITEFSDVSLKENRLAVKGVAFQKGYAAPLPNYVRTTLVLKAKNKTASFRLQQVDNPRLSNRYYEGAFCDYSYGAFNAEDPIDLHNLPFGRYQMQLQVRQARRDFPAMAVDWQGHASSTFVVDSLLQIRPNPGGTLLVKRPIVSIAPPQAHFEIEESWIKADILQIKGTFIVPGHEVNSHREADFYLALVPRGSGTTVPLRLSTYRKATDGSVVNDPWGIYTHSNFTTRRHRGMRLPELLPDTYDVAITAVFANGGVFSLPANMTITCSADGEAKLETEDSPVPA